MIWASYLKGTPIWYSNFKPNLNSKQRRRKRKQKKEKEKKKKPLGPPARSSPASSPASAQPASPTRAQRPHTSAARCPCPRAPRLHSLSLPLGPACQPHPRHSVIFPPRLNRRATGGRQQWQGRARGSRPGHGLVPLAPRPRNHARVVGCRHAPPITLDPHPPFTELHGRARL